MELREKFRSGTAALALTVGLVLSMAACGGEPSADAGVLVREATGNANGLLSCTASMSSTVEFTANAKPYSFQTSHSVAYQAKPFTLKSTQKSTAAGAADSSESYTAADGDKIWFYSNTDGKWQKTAAGNIDTTPIAQVDVLRLLSDVKSEKYVRETTLNSKSVHKIELTFDSDVLRGTLESIVTAAGMGQGSSTIVQSLLDSADTVYGYCYIDKDSGQLVRVDLDATETVNRVFHNIDGGNVTVNISKCVLSGTIGDINRAVDVQLPAAASAAQEVQAQG
ncbi:MAG: hypothetical protein GX424_09145 [Clostridiales bacterium]|nr:hypothetical protein [Clostridiales bacterium]